jgi:hypothetical protein
VVCAVGERGGLDGLGPGQRGNAGRPTHTSGSSYKVAGDEEGVE